MDEHAAQGRLIISAAAALILDTCVKAALASRSEGDFAHPLISYTFYTSSHFSSPLQMASNDMNRRSE